MRLQLARMAFVALVTSFGATSCLSTQSELPTATTEMGSLSSSTCAQPTSAVLQAGRHIEAGTVLLSNDESTLFITYETLGGWLISEAHAAVSGSLAGIPTTRSGQPAVGLFPLHSTVDGVDIVTFEVPLKDAGLQPGQPFVVAAHAVLRRSGDEESAWAGEVPFGARGSWATYVEDSVKLCPTGPVLVSPEQGGTAVGEGGISVTIAPGAISRSVVLEVQALDLDRIEAPLGTMLPLAALYVKMGDPEDIPISAWRLSAPLAISIPAGNHVDSESRVLIAQQSLIDSVEMPDGPVPRLVAVDTMLLNNGLLSTDSTVLPGVFSDGLFVVLSEGSPLAQVSTSGTGAGGFVAGRTSDQYGPRSGVALSNNTNTLVSMSGADGRYTQYVSRSAFTVTGFDTFRGSFGQTSGVVPVYGTLAQVDIHLLPLLAAPNTRPGIRNGGFEDGNLGDLVRWQTEGAARSIEALVCSGRTITPTEGRRMADINTGSEAVGGIGSAMKQVFKVPAGATHLSFDYNFVSEEFPEFVNSPFDDSFRVRIASDTKELLYTIVSVNASGGFELIGDCGFPGGDATSGMTGWRTERIDVSQFAGQKVHVELTFTATDAGDNIYDTHVLVDNLRFGTVWIDIKNINVPGFMYTEEDLRQHVREANVILSQAGLNLQVRNIRNLDLPSAYWDIDPKTSKQLLYPNKIHPTQEMTDLLAFSRSDVPSDINVYVIREFENREAQAGYAVTEEDHVGVSALVNAGVIVTTFFENRLCAQQGASGANLAHELGHMLISARVGGVLNYLEHNVWSTENIMKGNQYRCDLTAVINDSQSTDINRVGAPYVR